MRHGNCQPTDHQRRGIPRDDYLIGPDGLAMCDCGAALLFCAMHGAYDHVDGSVCPLAPTEVEVVMLEMCSAYCPGDYIMEVGNHFPECNQYRTPHTFGRFATLGKVVDPDAR